MEKDQGAQRSFGLPGVRPGRLCPVECQYQSDCQPHRQENRNGGKVRDPRSRDSGNTTLHKVSPGGHVTIAGANSAAGLASRPVRIVLCDEVDRYPSSAGTEGDPIRLAAKRATTGCRAHTATKPRPCAGHQCSGSQTDRRQRSMFVNIVALSGVTPTASNH